MKLLFLLHLGATLAMVGLIWLVQIVHYPLFARVGAEQFIAYEQDHARLITYIVLPLMLIELIGAVALLFSRPDGIPLSLVWIGAVLVAVIWLSTIFLQIPQHTHLAGGFDADAHRLLVLTNWLRTIAWSARGILMLWMLHRLLPAT